MPGREQVKDAIKILTAAGRNRGRMGHWRYFAYLRPFCLHPLRVPQGIPGKENTMKRRDRDLKAVVVRPEEYPQVVVIEDVCAWFNGAYIQIQAYTQDTVILAPEQKEGLTLNRGLFDPGQTQMRQIVAGDFLVCGVLEDGGFRSLTDQETYLYLERFRQPEKFLTAGNVIFCVPFAGRMSYSSNLAKKRIGRSVPEENA